MTFKEYSEVVAVNNSLLNMIASNPKWVEWKMNNVEIDDEDKVYFRIGSAIDCLLTEPYKFDSEFHIINLNKPQGLMGKFIYYLPKGLTNPFSLSEEMLKEFDYSEYETAYNKSEYKLALKTVVKNFWNDPSYIAYYLSSSTMENKQLLSLDEFKQVQFAVDCIRNNPNISGYFSKIRPDGDSIYPQFPIQWIYNLDSDTVDVFGDKEIEQIKCKGLLDLVIWNDADKTVRPVDLKSTGHSTYDFKKYFYEYGYFRQAAFYVEGLKAHLKEIGKEDYTILPFQFIVTPKKAMGYPALIYEVSEETLQHGYNGVQIGDKYYPGLTSLLKDYLWHKKHQDWSAPRHIIEKKYKLIL